MTSIPKTSVTQAVPSDPNPWARRLGILLTLATFLLIGTGGLVTSYNAGLAVPDWPGSFGKWIFLPARIWADLAVMLEHNHRLTGQLAGLICIATVVWAIRTRGWRSGVAILAWVVLAAYIYQGIMGGLRVTEKSISLAVIHGVQGQVLFMLVVVLAGCLGRWPGRIRSALAGHTGKRAVSMAVYSLAWAFVLLMVVQLTLGAVVRHTHSASAIPDAPAVYGWFYPPMDEDVIKAEFYKMGAGNGDWQVYVEEPALPMEAVESAATPGVLDHTPRTAATPPTLALVINQYVHRLMGMVFLPVVGIVLIYKLNETYKLVPGLRGPVAVTLFLFVVQVLLGLSVIWSKESPYVASSHQAVGAVLLGLATMILLRLHWARKFAE